MDTGDLISRWDVVGLFSRATATFLEAQAARVPFPARAIQVDGGSEFAAAFEAAGQQRGIRLFVLPPRSPKLNAHVERAQRTPTEEFCVVAKLEWTVQSVIRTLSRRHPEGGLGWRPLAPPYPFGSSKVDLGKLKLLAKERCHG